MGHRELAPTRISVGQMTRRLGILALLFVSICALTACGGGARPDFDLNRGEGVGEDWAQAEDVFSPSSADSSGRGSGWSYRIQGGDQLEVVFFTHPDQNRFVTVRPDGYMTLPFLGDVRAEGKLPTDLAAEIQEAYTEVLVSPRVDVIVQQMGARFYVLGQVNRPGEFVYEQRLNIVQALARAGGYDEDARLSNIVVLRREPETDHAFAALLNFRDYLNGNGRDANVELRPYDIVWVPRDALSTWDNAAVKLFRGVLNAESVAIQGWSLINFEDVFQNRGRF